MDITADITGIEYKIYFANDLKIWDLKSLDINKIPSSCIITDKLKTFAISKWVSPKRTRSYPFERIYNTLNISKKITVIPIIKDEGGEGDRDFIQWDTVSLMSLLDIYVIFAYYYKASKHKIRKDKITNQQFENTYILSKIKEISTYHSSALHWNLKEINLNLSLIIDKVKKSYNQIGKKTGVKFHNANGLIDFKKQFEDDVKIFMNESRKKAKDAANREQRTKQPKEILQTITKSTITIKNYLGGLYYLTTDEIFIKDKTISLIESKHSNSALLPSRSDIKDGLIKMILYSNLSNIQVDNIKYKTSPILKLTSVKIKGCIFSTDIQSKIDRFFIENHFNTNQKNIVFTLFQEANTNGFIIIIQNYQL